MLPNPLGNRTKATLNPPEEPELQQVYLDELSNALADQEKCAQLRDVLAANASADPLSRLVAVIETAVGRPLPASFTTYLQSSADVTRSLLAVLVGFLLLDPTNPAYLRVGVGRDLPATVAFAFGEFDPKTLYIRPLPPG